MNAIARQIAGRTLRMWYALLLTVVAGLALVAASMSGAPVFAHASPMQTTLRAASGNRPRVIPAKSPEMYCGMPNAPKVTLVHSATRAEAKADLVRFLGKAQAAAIGDNFILGSANDVVQGKTCYGGYNAYSATWGGIVADEYGSSSSANAYRLLVLGSWTGIGGNSRGSGIVRDGVELSGRLAAAQAVLSGGEKDR